MKVFALKVGLGPWKAARYAFDSRRSWSLKWTLNKYAAYGRVFLRTLIEDGCVKQKRPSQSVLIRRYDNVAVGGRGSKTPKWAAHVGRLISKWSSESWAAELRRNAAKRIMFQGGSTVPLFTLVGFTLAKEPSLLSDNERLQMACKEIRDIFQAENDKRYDECKTTLPEEMSLNDLELGKILDKGCNAVIYSATWKQKSYGFFNRTDSFDPEAISASVVNGNDLLCGHFGTEVHRLAVKVMFNYDAESNASSIWRAMHRESVPAQVKYLPNLPGRWTMAQFCLPAHPNIVDMKCAFADFFPNLPGAVDLYPDALPARLNQHGFGRNMTLVLVMKRYDCSLKEYLKYQTPPEDISLALFTQLLEGLFHLQKHQLSHRDLKADNILLQLSSDESAPRLVITDFGCCLSDYRLGLKLPFVTDDTFRWGNMALMPPEVATATSGRFSSIDYSKSDLWVTGALAYEIFGAKNPFYSSDNSFHLDSACYEEDDLPAFPLGAHPIVKRIVRDILQRNPKKRPGVQLVATCCQLLLHAPQEWLDSQPEHQEVICWLAETALNSLGGDKIFLNTFMARVQLDGIIEALKYMAQP